MKQAVSTGILLLFLAGVVFGFADVTGIGLSSRPLGMGKAFLGMSDDPGSALLNPAALANIKKPQFTSLSGRIVSEVGLMSLGADYPFGFGTIGAAYVSSSLPGINLTRIVGGTVEVLGQTDYSNTAIVLTYATPVSRFIGGFGGFNVGANLKLYNQSFSNQSGSLEGATGSGMDIDLSAQYQWTEDTTLGLTVQNALPVSAGGKFTWQKNQVVEGIPAVIKAGLAFKTNFKMVLAADLDMWPTAALPAALHLGVEHCPFPDFCVRFGIDQQSGPVAVESNLTAGIGYLISGFRFDYAYHQFGSLPDNTTHFLSLSYVGAEKKVEVKEEPPPPTAEAVKKAMEYKAFSDVAPSFWAYKPISQLGTLGIMSGYKDGTFRPRRGITRGDLLNMLARAQGKKPPKKQKNFNKALTLPEAVAIFVRFDKLTVPKMIYESPYRSLPARHWSVPEVTAAKEAGFLNYIGENAFDPKRRFTRAEVTYIFSKTTLGKNKIKEAFGE